jgi:hypothetical protein
MKMHNMHIVDIITKIARQNPEHRQELIDLATLGYRDGLITGKLNSIAESEAMDPEELDESELLPQEVDEIIESTENWFRELMTLNAKDMVSSYDEEVREAGEEYLQQSGQSDDMQERKKKVLGPMLNKVNLTEFMKNFNAGKADALDALFGNLQHSPAPRNRVKADMDKLNKENPGLFD